METEGQRHRGPRPGRKPLSLEQALRPRPGMLPLRWPERPGNPSCARSCLYLPGPRGGNHSKVPKGRLASIRKLGKRGYTTNHPASHTHIDGSMHTRLQRHMPILHTHEDKHIHIHVMGNTKHRHAGTHKFRPHEGASAHRGEWTRACRYAQRDTLLCVHTRTHTHTHTCVCAGAHRSPGQGPILSRVGRKAQAGSLLDGGVSGHMGRGTRGPPALVSPQQLSAEAGVPRMGLELTDSLKLGVSQLPASQLLPLLQ